MTSPITEEAKKIIDASPSHGPLRPAEYAKALPPRAGALARVLTDERIVAEGEKYRAADASAVMWRRVHGFLARSVLLFVTLAVVLGGVRLYLAASGDASSIEAARARLGQAQSFLLIVWLVSVTVLILLRPARRWFHERATAELARQRLFGLLMSGSSRADETEAQLLPLQLECFRRHLLEPQRGFFQRRSRQNGRIVKVGKLCGAVALLFIGVASLPQLYTSLSALGALDWTTEFLQELASRLLADRKLYALAWLVGISLQLLVTNLATVSPVARHAERYEVMKTLLDLDPLQLADVRKAAASDTRGPVEWFGKGILNVLSAETRMWLEREERRLGRLNRSKQVGSR